MRVALVGCSKAKDDTAGPMPARARYTSALFRKSLELAELEADRVYIVSASHGLIGPDDPLAWYDDSLRDRSKRARLAWGQRIVEALIQRHPDAREVAIWAGAEYADPIAAELLTRKRTALQPLRGLEIGDRLAYLNRILTAAHRAIARRSTP